VNPFNRGLLVVGIGLLTLQMAVTDTYLHFLRPSMRPYLLSAGVLFVLLGVAVCVTAWRGRDDRSAHEAGHDHHHASWVPWLLLLPIVIGVLAPDALDAYATARATPFTERSYPLHDFDVQKYLQTQTIAGGVPELPISDYLNAAWHRSNIAFLKAHDIRLLGFVDTSTPAALHFLLTRLHISCCAADATPMQIDVRVGSSEHIPAKNHWVEATVRLHATPKNAVIRVVATSLRPVAQPSKPYDYM
jgi:uncharacterized repeat protein (TIGR03943 family)